MFGETADKINIHTLLSNGSSFQAGSTLNTEYLDSLLSSDPEPIDLLPLKELEQEVKIIIIIGFVAVIWHFNKLCQLLVDGVLREF